MNFPELGFFIHQIKYPAPGAPDLAMRVKELLIASGFKRVNVEKGRKLDHGAWVPTMLMYPNANKDGTYHYNMGEALAPLREEGVLIFGSRSATHNLREMGMSNGHVVSWAKVFDTWLKESLLNGRYGDVNHYEKKAPYGKKAHPHPDHFYPLHVALGAA
ncbi:hypothetical protein IFM89_008528, partial [Coptis chinensis]